MCTLFEGGVSENVYALYNDLNVDNYGWPVNTIHTTQCEGEA